MNIQSKYVTPLGAVLCFAALATTASADIGYQFVTIGNAGNANDPATGSLYGGVNNTYAIGKYDVTLTQYTTFLNAVAQSDPFDLYDTSKATDLTIAGIARSGASGSYGYSVIGSGQRPVTYVSWFQAARFSNWLQNGQPAGIGEVAGSTEQGAYTLNGATTGIILKNANAQDWIPSESEWYKAAYYDPNKGGPGSGGYWQYPTRSDSVPGNVVGGAANQANIYNGVYSVTQSSSLSFSQNYLTDVGAFTNSASAYGTYDQGGEVYQWNDAVIGSNRGLRGGSWDNSSGTTTLQSSSKINSNPAYGGYGVGFRVATVPEPSTWALLTAGLAALLARRHHRKQTTSRLLTLPRL